VSDRPHLEVSECQRGGIGLSTLCETLEQDGDTHATDEAADTLSAIQEEHTAVRAALSEILAAGAWTGTSRAMAGAR